MTEAYWATQSAVTSPGSAAPAIDRLEGDITALRRHASQLVLHYRGRAKEVPEGRRDEIHTRFAADMLELILSRGAPSLARDRSAADRIVGCCRDFTVLFLTLLRQKGIPARARVGFGSYFKQGWWLDHVVAEVWDGQRWRLVDPQMTEGGSVDWCDLKPEQYLTGAQAWKAARDGNLDPAQFVVDPDLDLRALRSWAYLAHNVIHDLTCLGKKEMLLWDDWGMLSRHVDGQVPETDAAILDDISVALLDPHISPEVIKELQSRYELAVPLKITRFDPHGGPPKDVDVALVHLLDH